MRMRFILHDTVITFLDTTLSVNVRVMNVHKHELSLIKMYCSSTVYKYKINQCLKDSITLHVTFKQRTSDHMQTERL